MDETNNKDDCMKALKEWLQRQPHLPQNIDDIFLKRFISCSNSSLEKCKKLIDLNFTLRSQAPEIFDNRDPKDEAMINIFNAIDYCPLPKLTEKKYKVFIYRVNDTDPDKFLFADTLKAFFMVADVRLCKDSEETEGEIPIFDMAGTSLRHLTKITLPLVKKYMVYSQESHPIRLRQIHVMNIAPFLDKCMALIRPFLKSEVAQLVEVIRITTLLNILFHRSSRSVTPVTKTSKNVLWNSARGVTLRLHFHSPNSTTLFDYVPADLIPEEYGGTLPVSMQSIKSDWYSRVMSNRELFQDDTKWKVDESKRLTGKNSNKDLFGFQGSFRSLSID